MPAPRKLPTTLILRGLRNQGWTLEHIGAEYGVGESAVWKALERAGEIKARLTYRDLLPWRILPVHQTTGMMDRFRHIARQMSGERIGLAHEKRLQKWLVFLRSEGLVVDYSQEAPPNPASKKVGGFFYVDRSPEDVWIVRQNVGQEIQSLLSAGGDGTPAGDVARYTPVHEAQSKELERLGQAHCRIAELESALRKAASAHRGMEAVASQMVSLALAYGATPDSLGTASEVSPTVMPQSLTQQIPDATCSSSAADQMKRQNG